MIKVINKSKGCLITKETRLADTFFTRLQGLMFKNALNAGEGLIIKPCNMIHMFFMKFSLDVIFISKLNRVVFIIENLPPGRISPMISEAAMVLEVPVGTIYSTKTEVGDQLEVKHETP